MPVHLDKNAREYKHFVNSIKSVHTRDAYERGLIEFMEYAAIDTLAAFVSLDKKKLQDLIIDFVIEQRKQLAYASVSTKLSGVLRFCEMADIKINRRKVKSFLGGMPPDCKGPCIRQRGTSDSPSGLEDEDSGPHFASGKHGDEDRCSI